MRPLTRRNSFLSATCLVGAFAFLAPISAGAQAQDQTIDSEETAPVLTLDRLGPDAATLTIGTDGSIIVTSGTPLTINGPHSLTLQGRVATEGLENVDGVLIQTSDLNLGGTIDITGVIDVIGTADTAATDLSNNVGLRLSGTQAYTGTITVGGLTTGSIAVEGVGSRGVLIEAPLIGNFAANAAISVDGGNNVGIDIAAPVTGDVFFDGSMVVTSANSAGILVRDVIDGSLSVLGDIAVGEASTFDSDGNLVDAQPALGGVVINRSITGGFIFNGAGISNQIDTDDDGVVDFPSGDADIASFGGAPAILVNNTATDGSTLTLGSVVEDVDLGYGFISRSNISVTGESVGLNSTGIAILSDGPGGTVIDGGILFDTGSITVTALDAEGYGIRLGSGTTTPRLDFLAGGISVQTGVNDTLDDDGELVPGLGGDATAILIEQGANLPTISNQSNVLVAVGSGEGATATVIRDLSGTLTRFDNIGTPIEVGSSVLDAGIILAGIAGEDIGETIAFDVRANTSGFTLYSSGVITGDILLGSGDDLVELDGIEAELNSVTGAGRLEGDIDFGAGANRLVIRNDGNFVGAASFTGSLDLEVDNASVSLSTFNPLTVTNATLSNATLITDINPADLTAGQLTVTDTLTLTGPVTVDANLESFVGETTEFVIVDSGAFVDANDGTDFELINDPFLFDTSIQTRQADGREQLVLVLDPVSAEELGLTPTLTQYYGAIQQTLDPDPQLEQAIANLPDSNSVRRALSTLAPDFTNRVFEMVMANQRHLNRNFSERLDDYVHKLGDPTGAWAVEHAALGRIDTTDKALNSDYQNFGLSLGYTGRLTENFAVGGGVGFSLIGASTGGGLGSDISIFAPYINGYWLYKIGGLYVGGSGTTTFLDIQRTRNLFDLELQRTITSDSSGWNLSATGEIGYALKIGNFTLKPFAQIMANVANEGGYTEQGGDSADTVVDGRSMDRVDARFAASASYEFYWTRNNDGEVTVRPEVTAGIDRFVSGTRFVDLDARFRGSDDQFTLGGQQLTQDSEFVGGALSFFGNATSARIRYAYEDRESVRIHSATFNFRLAF